MKTTTERLLAGLQSATVRLLLLALTIYAPLHAVQAQALRSPFWLGDDLSASMAHVRLGSSRSSHSCHREPGPAGRGDPDGLLRRPAVRDSSQ